MLREYDIFISSSGVARCANTVVQRYFPGVQRFLQRV